MTEAATTRLVMVLAVFAVLALCVAGYSFALEVLQ